MTFNQFLRIIRSRWVLVLSIVTVVVLSTLGVSLMLTKQYTASATVMADVRPDPVSPYAMAGAMANTYLATQVDIIKSANVAQRVVRTLRLTENPQMRELWMKQTKGQGDVTAWAADLIDKGLTVKPSRESNVIEIQYEGNSPGFASTLANAYARAYIDSTVQIKVGPARQYAEFFEERARAAREKLERAREKLAEAQREKGIVLTDERLDVETARLAELSSQVNALRAMRSETTSRRAQASANPEQLNDVLNNPVVANLKTDLARQEGRLRELSERLGDAHPQVIESRATIDSLRAQIRNETSRVTGSVRGGASMAAQREAEAIAAFEAQRERLLKLKESRTDLQVMEREVETAQRIYDSIQERLSQTNLESQTSQSGIYLLSSATEPTSPTSPRVFLNTAVSLVLGTLLALMVAMTVELFDRRVRSPIDITQALDIPVIGVLPAPKSHRRLTTARLRLAFGSKSAS
ncbi:MAG: chain length determinant protein EpsF [Aquabacterium sp.]|jgi:chain length determinant protein EpsF|uniref:chain length determinant protein EpsF n=1 Tax=Aquabacterium sp. TaxID=1872578 RepID=UPI002A36089C|nr:chain length determinant protein EpsF [Aquabacterium sp.]MDX9844588.1 chain length determinant protein EpsF [Aquabacterium sp.]